MRVSPPGSLERCREAVSEDLQNIINLEHLPSLGSDRVVAREKQVLFNPFTLGGLLSLGVQGAR